MNPLSRFAPSPSRETTTSLRGGAAGVGPCSLFLAKAGFLKHCVLDRSYERVNFFIPCIRTTAGASCS